MISTSHVFTNQQHGQLDRCYQISTLINKYSKSYLSGAIKCCIKIQSMTTLLVFFRQILTKCSFVLLLEKAKNGLQSNNAALAWSKVKLHVRSTITFRTEKWRSEILSNMSKTRASCQHRETNESTRPNAFIVSRCLEPLMKHEARVFDMTSQSRLKIQCNKACKINVFPAGMVNSYCKSLPVFESRFPMLAVFYCIWWLWPRTEN